MDTIIQNNGLLSNPALGSVSFSHKKKSCEKEYTLSDVESKLNAISNISVFLTTGDCPDDIAINLRNYLHDEIQTLQSMLSFIRLYPELKAEQ